LAGAFVALRATFNNSWTRCTPSGHMDAVFCRAVLPLSHCTLFCLAALFDTGVPRHGGQGLSAASHHPPTASPNYHLPHHHPPMGGARLSPTYRRQTCVWRQAGARLVTLLFLARLPQRPAGFRNWTPARSDAGRTARAGALPGYLPNRCLSA